MDTLCLVITLIRTARRDTVLYILLLGGDKSTQKRDIKRATKMARELEERA